MSFPNQLPPVLHDEPVGPDYINNLNDDCLGRIFQFLPVVDKFRIQAVCKRWNELSDLAWEDKKSLSFDYWGEYPGGVTLPERVWPEESIKRVLKKCGSHLKKLAIRGYEELLPVIGEYCPNLVHFQIDLEDELWKTNAVFPNLQSLRVSMSAMYPRRYKPDDFFQALSPDKLIEIDLKVSTCSWIYLPPTAPIVLSNCTKLAVIKLEGFVLKSTVMNAIWKLSNLKTIELSGEVEGQFPSFTCLKHLEHIALYVRPDIDDSTLDSISKNCPGLKTMAFSSSKVTPQGLSKLNLLEKLEDVKRK